MCEGRRHASTTPHLLATCTHTHAAVHLLGTVGLHEGKPQPLYKVQAESQHPTPCVLVCIREKTTLLRCRVSKKPDSNPTTGANTGARLGRRHGLVTQQGGRPRCFFVLCHHQARHTRHHYCTQPNAPAHTEHAPTLPALRGISPWQGLGFKASPPCVCTANSPWKNKPTAPSLRQCSRPHPPRSATCPTARQQLSRICAEPKALSVFLTWIVGCWGHNPTLHPKPRHHSACCGSLPAAAGPKPRHAAVYPIARRYESKPDPK